MYQKWHVAYLKVKNDIAKGELRRQKDKMFLVAGRKAALVVRIRRMSFHGESCSRSRITLISDAMRNHLTKHDVRQS